MENLTHSTTSFFRNATFLNDPSEAYNILDAHLPAGWYPENAETNWTDIAVLDGKYYAVYGEDVVTTQDSKAIYIEIEPTKGMVSAYKGISTNNKG